MKKPRIHANALLFCVMLSLILLAESLGSSSLYCLEEKSLDQPRGDSIRIPKEASYISTQIYSYFLGNVASTEDLHQLYNPFMASDPCLGTIFQQEDGTSWNYYVPPNQATSPIGYVSKFNELRFFNWYYHLQLEDLPTDAPNDAWTESGMFDLEASPITWQRDLDQIIANKELPPLPIPTWLSSHHPISNHENNLSEESLQNISSTPFTISWTYQSNTISPSSSSEPFLGSPHNNGTNNISTGAIIGSSIASIAALAAGFGYCYYGREAPLTQENSLVNEDGDIILQQEAKKNSSTVPTTNSVDSQTIGRNTSCSNSSLIAQLFTQGRTPVTTSTSVASTLTTGTADGATPEKFVLISKKSPGNSAPSSEEWELITESDFPKMSATPWEKVNRVDAQGLTIEAFEKFSLPHALHNHIIIGQREGQLLIEERVMNWTAQKVQLFLRSQRSIVDEFYYALAVTFGKDIAEKYFSPEVQNEATAEGLTGEKISQILSAIRREIELPQLAKRIEESSDKLAKYKEVVKRLQENIHALPESEITPSTKEYCLAIVADFDALMGDVALSNEENGLQLQQVRKQLDAFIERRNKKHWEPDGRLAQAISITNTIVLAQKVWDYTKVTLLVLHMLSFL